MKKKKIPVNKSIRAKEVRLVAEKGEHFGVVPLEEAIKKAKERKLDLVQITDNVEPPVCKIIDYGKYSYKKKKKKKEGKESNPQVKSIRLGFAISDHDMKIRAKSAKNFLENGDSVHIVLPLKGRQKALEGVGREKVKKFIEMMKEEVEIKKEKDIKKEPRGITATITKK